MGFFGAYIREGRKTKGMILRKACEKLDMDTALLSKYERGVRQVRYATAIAMMDLYDLDKSKGIKLLLQDTCNKVTLHTPFEAVLTVRRRK